MFSKSDAEKPRIGSKSGPIIGENLNAKPGNKSSSIETSEPTFKSKMSLTKYKYLMLIYKHTYVTLRKKRRQRKFENLERKGGCRI